MKTIHSKLVQIILSGIIVLAYSAPPTAAEDHAHHHAGSGSPSKGGAAKEPTHLYGNHKCPISGEGVSPDSFVEYQDKGKGIYGRIYLCCQGCEKKVKKDLGKAYTSLYRIDPKTGKAKAPVDLKNAKCPMSGEPADPEVKIEYNGMIVHFCCADCAGGFLKEPETKMSGLLPNAEQFKFKAEAGSHSSHGHGG